MLDETILATMRALITQRRDDFSVEGSKKQKTLLANDAGKGFASPSGMYRSGLFELRKESIRKLSEIVLAAAIEVLDAHKQNYYPEIGDDLKQFLNAYLPENLAEPDDSIKRMGFSDSPFRNKESERSQLENIRCNSLFRLNTNIDLYVAKIKSKESSNMDNARIIHTTNYVESMNGGHVAGHDINIQQNQNITRDDFVQLLQQLKHDISQSDLDMNNVEVINGDIETVESQLQKDNPSKSIISRKLEGINGLMEDANTAMDTAEKGSDTVVRVLGTVTKLMSAAGLLF
jgi:hypothetical protein